MTERQNLAGAGVHALGPFAQGLGIVLAEMKRVFEFQAGPFGFLAETSQGGKHSAGENIMADEIRARAIRSEKFVLDGDGLDDRTAALLEPVGKGGEILRPIMFADCLEHLN